MGGGDRFLFEELTSFGWRRVVSMYVYISLGLSLSPSSLSLSRSQPVSIDVRVVSSRSYHGGSGSEIARSGFWLLGFLDFSEHSRWHHFHCLSEVRGYECLIQ